MEDLSQIQKPLLEWYQIHQRNLPWRSDPTAYHVWISEIMLQQTRVEAVKGYYQRFLKALPDVYALSQVEEEVLLKLWEGLGYYNRAFNLKKAALIVVEKYQGILPSEYEELLKLPGIGSYTAGAIASIAYHKKVPAVDGNVFRVMTRLLASTKNIDEPSTRKWLEQLLLEILPEDASIFNQALMEIGATVCLPNGEPKCLECPFFSFCEARKQNLIAEIPVRKKKKNRKIEEKTILLFYFHNKVALLKRDNKGLLKGMYEFPNVNHKMTQKEVLQYLKEEHLMALKIEPLKEAKHIFSHIEWHMTGYQIFLDDCESQKYIWVDLKDFKEYAIPSAFSTYLELIKEDGKLL